MAAAEADSSSEERALQGEAGSVNPTGVPGGGAGACLTTRIRLPQAVGRTTSPIPISDVVHTTVAVTLS